MAQRPGARAGNGRISAHIVERRIAHSNVLARAVELDMVAIGWRPSAENYFGKVTKARILEAVTEGRGETAAGQINHLKKPDMAREAELLMAEAGWLPESLRTPGRSTQAELLAVEEPAAVPEFLGEPARDAAPGEDEEPMAIAAE